MVGSNEHRRRAPAVPHAIAGLRELAANAARDAGAVDGTVSDIRLAVSEAATNAVLHAYRDRPPGPVEIAVAQHEDALVVEVRDEGGGVRPRMDSPGAHLGLPLISHVTDSVEVQTSPDGGTLVRMRFRLTSTD